MGLFLKVSALLWVAAAFSPRGEAADLQALIKQLGSENGGLRAEALSELRKMGQPACEALAKTESTETLAPQQLLLVRRIQGDFLIPQSTLQPLDRANLTPWGEDKEKGIPGNPNLLVNRDKKLIVMNGQFEYVQENEPLEYLVVTRGDNAPIHENVTAVYARPRDICLALFTCAYTPAAELGREEKANLPKDAGVLISVEYLWEPAHADMDTALDAATVIAAFQQKYALFLLEKASAEEYDKLLLDMSSDHYFLRRLLDQDEVDNATGQVTAPSPFTEQLRNERCMYDEAGRKAFFDMLQGYLKKHPAIAAAVAKPHPLPEKKLMRVPIEYFAWNTQTDRPMKHAPFAFTGSKFEKDPETKKQLFLADLRNTIAACRFDTSAILNSALDTRGISPYRAAGYKLNWRAVPRRGTKCRVIFEPWTGGELKDEDLKDSGDTSVKPAPVPGPL